MQLIHTPKIFKTAWFSKNASKADIADAELCDAAKELNLGMWDADLGANVFKKRLNLNRHRSILITKSGVYWIFVYLFAKADRENIDKDELNPDFPLGLEMATQNILMDFLGKFEGNSHSIDQKFAQERRKMGKLTFK